MDVNNSGFFAKNWGNVASVLGLLVSIVSAFFAKRASVAAKSARDAVFLRNIADDMAQANRVASDLTNLIETGKFDAAVSRCSELQDLSVFIQQRWIGELAPTSKQNCLAVTSQLDTVHRVLGRFSKDLTLATPSALERLTKSCRSVKLVFVKEEAIAKRTVDGGDDAR